MKATLETKIGLEVHCQLTNLRSKLFCGCSANYRGKEPNTHMCPVCLGLPGSLPVLNSKAIEDAIMIALALGADISSRTLFFRKNYFYPDMPKNFQISQYDQAGGVPIAAGGSVSMGNGKKVRIRMIQIEEDPAKLSYEGTIDSASATLVDYNRAGIALMEIVTEPDLESPNDARLFLQNLRSILEHLGVSDGSLEGSMRCDANISLGEGRRVEIKNISSFKEVERALNFEIARQKSLLDRGAEVKMETRHWDELRRVTVSLRVKEEEHDYRYFPEPDLVPIAVTPELIDKVKANMPELPEMREERFVEEYDLPHEAAQTLTGNKRLADFFEDCVKSYPDAKKIGNWLVSDFLRYLYEAGLDIDESRVTPNHLVKMLQLIDSGVISGKIAKQVLKEMMTTGRLPDSIVEEKGLRRISSRNYIESEVEKVFKELPQAVNDALSDEKAVNYLIGELMRRTSGKCDPTLANEIVSSKLSKLKSKQTAA